MLTIQQLIKALRKLQNGNTTAKTAVDLAKYLKNATATTTTAPTTAQQAIVTSLFTEQHQQQESAPNFGALQTAANQQAEHESSKNDTTTTTTTNSSQNLSHSTRSQSTTLSQSFQSNDDDKSVNATLEHLMNSNVYVKSTQQQQPSQDFSFQRSQQIQKFYQQQLLHFHTQQSSLQAKQQQTQFAMSSLAAAMEQPLALKQEQKQDDAATVATNDVGSSKSQSSGSSNHSSSNGISCQDDKTKNGAAAPCFNTGLAEILKFMELIGNLKHTKRTGWVLRDVNDCESISGHMYRMSMMTFLLDGSEGLNQIRCMELALVHDLAESLVGDITPFCGVSKAEKRAMEFKAMDDICKLIEPRGKRIMELFEEYEQGESPESKFVKDLDRLDMVMQAFEYEKRDNCLLKHQEFFDSTEGKFNHPFVKKLVDEICEQRNTLAQVKGATPPPSIQVPDMDAEDIPAAARNGHCAESIAAQREKQQTNSNSS